MSEKSLVFIVGTTASGKSNLALNLAKEFHGAICNMDSVQVYSELNIGSAKPSVKEQNMCPHYLFDLVSAPSKLTAGDYRRSALEIIEDSQTENHLFFVGGSGFYVQALEKGMFDTIKITAEQKRETEDYIEKQGLDEAFEEIQKRDPVYASKLHRNDKYRIHRALEVLMWTSKTVSQLRAEKIFDQSSLADTYPLLKVGVYFDRDQLRERVRERVLKMLDLGFVDEVRTLVAKGYKNWTPLQSVGYKEVIAYLENTLSEDELVDEIVKNTMKLAKKQRTWFQRDEEIKWFHGEKELLQAESYIREWLER